PRASGATASATGSCASPASSSRSCSPARPKTRPASTRLPKPTRRNSSNSRSASSSAPPAWRSESFATAGKPCISTRAPLTTLPTAQDAAREPAMEPLKFVALDKDDLDVVSTHLQDAEVKVADVFWRPQEKRLVIGLDRFDWIAATAAAPEFLRRRSALRFE